MILPLPGKTVGDAMSDAVMTVSLNQAWADVIPGLRESKVSCIVILDEDQRPMGLLTALNLLPLVLPHGLELAKKRVSDSRPFSRLVPVHRAAPLWDAVNTMDVRQVDRLVVIDDTMRCCGVISATDIMKCVLDHEPS